MSTKPWDPGTGPSLLRGLFARWQGQPRGGPGALLWDMDGLLVDSEPVWTLAQRELFATWGAEFTPAMKAAMVGTRLDVSVPMMIRFGGSAAEAAGATVPATQEFLLGRMRELFAESVPLRPGAGHLLAEVAEAGIPQALVSSSYRGLVDEVLRGLPGHPFAVSLAGDEVARGKPDPESYETAAARLGVRIDRCVVLEDSPAGARSGAVAGARVLYCPSVSGAAGPEPGWRPVSSLQEVSLAGLRAWCRR